MDIVFLVVLVFFICIWLWLNVLALLCLFLDPELEKIQRWGQSVVVILIPYIGAAFILKLINDHSPEVVSKFFIPWPFKNMVKDTALRTGGDATTNWVDSPGDRSNSSNGDGGSGGSGSE